ncbi:hypothetical protein [Chryseobacterium sp. JM1]|uniref:hypothetical protein n=1 Tax=Chryseobacterium sp. JM1 TaxID=1233950 RepID=UPI0004E67FA0|nr:hypothetical protein [Chryseobacterium sp. JM1]KFF22682.1 hypothetical protein IW22_00020 [Chryseobacterium sp. JM1]
MKKIILCLIFAQNIICFGQNTLNTNLLTKQSMISLIANAENYIEKKVILKGFLNIQKDDMAIYLSKDDFINFNTNNAIYLFLSIDDMNKLNITKMSRKYVSIMGTFYIPKNKDIQMGDNYIGALKNIEYVELIEQRRGK